MPKPFYSSSWYRVSGLKPGLRSQARINRQHFRGQLWYVLEDPTSGRLHRFTPAAYAVIGLMDGNRTVEEIWLRACRMLGDDALTQDDMIRLLSQLHQTDVLHADVRPDVDEMSDRAAKTRRRKLIASTLNPMALRLPLFDPDAFLTASARFVTPVFSRAGAICVVLLIGYAAVLAGMYWPQLTENITDRVLAAKSIVVLLAAYPVVKILHELGHAYAVKRWGGEVHELGVMFLVFMPVPYVDASAASAFPQKWRRALVGAAGIIVEVVLASLALLVWINAEEGLVRAIAFNVMVIGGTSTVIFNGNPLLRFDGYYVLGDLLEIPNLADRSRRYIGYLLLRHAFGVHDATNPASAPGEPFWLFSFAVASFLYRLFVVSLIVLVIATKFFIVGIVLAIWAAIMMLGVPAAKIVWFLFKNPILAQQRERAVTVCSGGLAVTLLILLALPLPYRTTAEGIVWSPGEPGVYAGSDGTVVAMRTKPNAIVSRGDALAELQDPLLDAEVRVLEAMVKELELRRSAVALTDPFQKQLFEEQLTRSRGDLALRRKRQADLIVRSPGDGRFIVKRPDDLVGKFLHKGDLLGYIAVFDHPTAIVVVSEESADLVRVRTRAIDVRLTTAVGENHLAHVGRSVPNINNVLPSLALSTIGGGDVAMDPRDPKSMKALANVLHLELEFDDPFVVSEIGERVYVRFDHGYEPLAWRFYLNLRQLFLRRFNV